MTVIYEIKVQGQLKPSWSEWLNGMNITIEVEPEGLHVTTLKGAVIDQAALHGLLDRIRDLGLPLLSVKRVSGSVQDPTERGPG